MYQNFIAIYCLFIPMCAFAVEFQMSDNRMSGGERITLDILDGEPPFLWISEVGHISSVEDDAYQFHLQTPEISGLFNLQLRDSQGQQSTQNYLIQWGEFSISPQYIYSKPGEMHNIAIHDAGVEVKVVPEDRWKWLDASQGTSIQYTAPEKAGFYTLTFSPQNNPGNTRQAHVYVYPELKATLNARPVEIDKIIYLEPENNYCFEIQGGVAPYFWIEGGKGQLSDGIGHRVCYIPSVILGEDPIYVYDSTGQFIKFPLYTKGDFYLTPQNHSICPTGLEVRFKVNGGEPPYFISPPKDSEAVAVVDETETSLTLRFNQAGIYEIVASDNLGENDFSHIEVKAQEQCDVELPIQIDASIQLPPRVSQGAYPVLLYIKNPPIIPSFYPLIKRNDAAIKWSCWTLNCQEEDFSSTIGNSVVFFPPKQGFYTLNAESQKTGEHRVIELYVFDNLFNIYAGSDYHLNEEEVGYLVQDFFAPDIYYSRTEIYEILEIFLNGDTL